MGEFSFSWNESSEITPSDCETENRNFLSDSSNDVQCHHEMNLPNSILGQPFSLV